MYKVYNKAKAEQTATPSKYPQGRFKPKPCRKCGTEFPPKAPSELYCSDPCRTEALNDRYLERAYGITLEDYRRMLKEQDSKCKLCGGEGFLMDTERHSVKLVVDHCHKDGHVRGLLCHNCNRALGLLQDDKETLQRAIDYLS